MVHVYSLSLGFITPLILKVFTGLGYKMTVSLLEFHLQMLNWLENSFFILPSWLGNNYFYKLVFEAYKA